jgi:hypothetical protein
MSEATQLTQISDNTNHGYIAGRDLYLGDQYVVQETLYFEPDLQDVEPPAWTTTPKAEELAGVLVRQRLIVLAGQELDDKTMVARHLAWLLRQQLDGEVLVREWYRSSDPQKIETAFHETATTILLLPQVLPHHVGHRLNELRRVLHNRQNYLIITTDGTRSDWQITSGSLEECLWCELSWKSYYGKAFLADFLLQELTTGAFSWLPQSLRADSVLLNGLTVEDAAVRLRQPDRIRHFCQSLLIQDAPPRDLLAQINRLSGDRAAILQWYRQLARNNQLLALGIIFFDGLADDQIFAALEILVNEAWRQSDPNLPLFDYKDLEDLSAYFHITETGEDGTRIETTSRQKREAILQAAWELQRRRLLSAVPAITQLLKKISPADEAAPAPDKTPSTWKSRFKPQAQPKAPESSRNWRLTGGAERELFSSSRRAQQLQRSLIESLSQIGLLSFDAVEASFLELAVNGSSGFQTIVAKALAAWRGDGHSEKLFRVLRSWWEEGCVANSAKSLAQQTVRAGEDPRTAMRATVALAAGYALQYDPPNKLNPEMLGLIEALVQDQYPPVRARVLELTLPLAAASHLRQLEPLLRSRLTTDQEHMYAIAFGVAMAYSIRPAESLEIIERWHAVVRSQGPRDSGDLTITPRDRILSAVALAYGYIRCEHVHGLLDPEQVVSTLRSILAAETHPFVRTHALMALGLQAVENFELVSTPLKDLISEATLQDRLHIISILVRAYLRQREQLKGGDEEIEIGGRKFQVWSRSVRPQTVLEASLYSWLQDDQNPVAQQVAVQTIAAMAATELDQKEREVASRRPPVAPPARLNVVRVDPNPPRLRRLNRLGRMAVFLTAPHRKDLRARLSPIVAEAIEVRRAERFYFFDVAGGNRTAGSSSGTAPRPVTPSLQPAVLKKLAAAGDQGLQRLGRSVGIALDIYKWRMPIVLALALSCGLLYYDIKIWQESFSDPLSVPEARVLQQRAAIPMRVVWNLWSPELRRREEQRKREEQQRFEEQKKYQEELRIAAERAAAAQKAPSEPRPSAPPPERSDGGDAQSGGGAIETFCDARRPSPDCRAGSPEEDAAA